MAQHAFELKHCVVNKILTSQENRKTLLCKRVNQNLRTCGIKEEDIRNREVFRKKIVQVRHQREPKAYGREKNRLQSARERRNTDRREKMFRDKDV